MKLVKIKDVRVGQIWINDKTGANLFRCFNEPVDKGK